MLLAPNRWTYKTNARIFAKSSSGSCYLVRLFYFSGNKRKEKERKRRLLNCICSPHLVPLCKPYYFLFCMNFQCTMFEFSPDIWHLLIPGGIWKDCNIVLVINPRKRSAGFFHKISLGVRKLARTFTDISKKKKKEKTGITHGLLIMLSWLILGLFVRGGFW